MNPDLLFKIGITQVTHLLLRETTGLFIMSSAQGMPLVPAYSSNLQFIPGSAVDCVALGKLQ